MARLNTLLVHPDPDVRYQLRERLADSGLLRVLGEAVNAEEALTLLDALPYGAVFAGIQLAGDMSGLEFARALGSRKHSPALVFIACREDKAFNAFELGAADYLLWPATDERLERTFEKLEQFKARFKEIPYPGEVPAFKGTVDEEQTLQIPMEDDEEERFLTALQQAWEQTSKSRQVEIEKLPISLEGRTLLIPYNRIIFIEAYEDYSYVHTASDKYLTSYRLKNLEDRLKPYRFFRVHRKYLVNLDMVTEIASLPGSNFMLRTAGKTRIELPISRRRITELKEILGL
jgi:DNA-binding LytR/AlgR family response regulator